MQEAGGGPWGGPGEPCRLQMGLGSQGSLGTPCQDLTAEQEGRAVHREVLTHPPAWRRSFWRNVSYEEGGAGRPRQSVMQHGPLEKVMGDGHQSQRRPWQGLGLGLGSHPEEKTSPDPSIRGAGDLGGPQGRGAPSGPSKGRSALLGLC